MNTHKLLSTVLLVSAMMLAFSACQSPLKSEDVAEPILEGERSRIPLYIQKYELEDLTIDSISFLNEEEPMSALLYTNWTYEEVIHEWQGYHRIERKSIKTKQMIVELTDIQRCKENSKSVEWSSNWAFVNLRLDRSIYK